MACDGMMVLMKGEMVVLEEEGEEGPIIWELVGVVDIQAAVEHLREMGMHKAAAAGPSMQGRVKSMSLASTRATAELLSLGFWIKPSVAEPTQLPSLWRFAGVHFCGLGHYIGE